MKKLAILNFFLLFFSFSTFSHSQEVRKKIYNIYEYEMKLKEGEFTSVFYSNKRCYQDWIEHSHDRDFFYLKSKYWSIKFHILKITEDKEKRDDWKLTRYFAVFPGNSHPYSIVEVDNGKKFYLAIIPIRFNSMCSIDEAGMLISTEEICPLP